MDLSHRNYKSLTKSHTPNITVLQHIWNLQITRYIFTGWLLHSSSTTNFPCLSPTEHWLVTEPNKFCHLYSRGTDTPHGKHASPDHQTPLRDVTAYMENTASSTVAWQHVDQIRYNTLPLFLHLQRTFLSHMKCWLSPSRTESSLMYVSNSSCFRQLSRWNRGLPRILVKFHR
jgi:hypothetical protein